MTGNVSRSASVKEAKILLRYTARRSGAGKSPSAISASSAWDASTSSSRRARRKAVWRSRSASMSGDPRLGDALGFARLTEKSVKGGQILVPFDETGREAEAFEDARVKLPDRLGNDRSMVVDQNLGTAAGNARMSGEVNFADEGIGERFAIGVGVQIEIGAAYEDVVDVEQDAAAGAARELGEKIGLANRGMAEMQITRRILHQDGPSERLLCDGDIPRHDVERLLGIGQWQKIIEINPVRHAP